MSEKRCKLLLSWRNEFDFRFLVVCFRRFVPVSDLPSELTRCGSPSFSCWSLSQCRTRFRWCSTAFSARKLVLTTTGRDSRNWSRWLLIVIHFDRLRSIGKLSQTHYAAVIIHHLFVQSFWWINNVVSMSLHSIRYLFIRNDWNAHPPDPFPKLMILPSSLHDLLNSIQLMISTSVERNSYSLAAYH